MAGISAVNLGDNYLEVLSQIAQSPLIRTKQEALLFLSGWMGDILRAQSAAFQEPAFREEALKIIYYKS